MSEINARISTSDAHKALRMQVPLVPSGLHEELLGKMEAVWRHMYCADIAEGARSVLAEAMNALSANPVDQPKVSELPTVGVKPLNWGAPSGHSDANMQFAHTDLGLYFCLHPEFGTWHLERVQGSSTTHSTWDSEAHAKAFAQSKWDELIRSALIGIPGAEKGDAESASTTYVRAGEHGLPGQNVEVPAPTSERVQALLPAGFVRVDMATANQIINETLEDAAKVLEKLSGMVWGSEAAAAIRALKATP